MVLIREGVDLDLSRAGEWLEVKTAPEVFTITPEELEEGKRIRGFTGDGVPLGRPELKEE